MSTSTEPSATDWTVEPFNADEDAPDSWTQDAGTPAGGGGGGLPAFLDPEIEAELGAGPPEWMGIRWREISAEHKTAAWTALRQWVDWFVREYQLNTSQITECWFEHSDIVAELYAGMCAEYKIWEEGTPGLGAMTTWHPHVQAMTARLAAMVDKRQCHITGHQDDPADLAFTYNQDRWARIRDGITTTVEVPRERINRRWRPVAVARGGEVITGREILVGPAAAVEAAQITGTTLLSGAAADSVQLRHTTQGVAAESYWEHTTGTGGQDGWTRHTDPEAETGPDTTDQE
ncbi:hypothetical protein BMF89_14830 [Arthrobacter sp. SRS-W-1-2016]|uniref:hypothetical protein n=1 Tax=Arthrobacter sp. SRS-W-1-2016 TaxID=1930254 RepID=UPI000990C591|nr:hypothetical protein [Arthrobacter sp. SRS-W-1-2016]OOP60912.1 hypothetical protein BMF89_14830 [Arthrobacter sp. SRS-W-1-2016]